MRISSIKKKVATMKSTSAKKPRQGWDTYFKLMRARGEDRLLISDVIDVFCKVNNPFPGQPEDD